MFICYVFQFNFGDLILTEFPSAGKHLPIYVHWAVYVGKGKVEGLKDKLDDEDIFYAYGKETYSRLHDFIYCVKTVLCLNLEQYFFHELHKLPSNSIGLELSQI